MEGAIPQQGRGSERELRSFSNRRTTVSIGSGATAVSHSVAVRRRGLRDSGRELWQVVVSGAERGSGAWVGSGGPPGSCAGVQGCAAGWQGCAAGVPMAWWGSGVRGLACGRPGGDSEWIPGHE